MYGQHCKGHTSAVQYSAVLGRQALAGSLTRQTRLDSSSMDSETCQPAKGIAVAAQLGRQASTAAEETKQLA